MRTFTVVLTAMAFFVVTGHLPAQLDYADIGTNETVATRFTNFGAANQKRSYCNRSAGIMISSDQCWRYRTFLKLTNHSDRKGLWP